MLTKLSVHMNLSQDQAGACGTRGLVHPAQVCGAHAAGFGGCFLLVHCQLDLLIPKVKNEGEMIFGKRRNHTSK